MEYASNEVSPCLAQNSVCSPSFLARAIWKSDPRVNRSALWKLEKQIISLFFSNIVAKADSEKIIASQKENTHTRTALKHGILID